jgi:benzylsuccinate CoA-transferase BbsF subunit
MDHSTGNNVAYALLLALYRRKRTGQGMRIDLTMQETGVSAIGPAILEAQRGISRPRLGCSHLWKSPHNIYPCRGTDRWIAIVVSNDEEWRRLREAMGEPSWAADVRFDTVLGRCTHRHELDELLGHWTAEQDDQELMQLLQDYGVPAGAALTAADLASNVHLKERCYLQEFDNTSASLVGPRVYAGRPFRIPGIPMNIRNVATLGEHNLEVLRNVAGLSETELKSLAKDGIISNRPRPSEQAP